MKRILNIIVALSFFMAAMELSAQDRIYFRGKAPVEAVVLEIGEDYVLYRTYDNQDGPQYRQSISDIEKIVFENGTVKSFKGKQAPDMDIFGSLAVMPGLMDYRSGRYYIGITPISREDIIDYIGYTNFGSRYVTAKRQYVSGLALTCTGAGMLLAGIMLTITSAADGPSTPDFSSDFPSYFPDFSDTYDSYEKTELAVCITSYVLGAAALGAGIPLLVSGDRKLRGIADEYNRRHGYSSSGRGGTLMLGGCRSGGIGLAFNF